MPKLTSNALLQRAIEPALNDRLSFIDAVAGDPRTVAEAQAEWLAIKGLRGKKLSALNAEEHRAAMLAFLYAEQWETSYADSSPGRKYEIKSRADACRFRELRLRLWGPTKLEVAVAGATSINVYDFLHGKG